MAAPAGSQQPPDAGDAARTRHDHTRFIAAVVVVAALGLWLPQLTSSFTADEAVTHWVTRDGLDETLARAYRVQQQHSLYFLVELGVRNVLGSSELALRLLSLLAISATTVLVWRLGKRLLDDDAGLLAAAVFVTSPGIIFAAGDARPYAFALLAVVASSLFLIRWADTESKRNAVGYAIFTAASIYFHYLAGIALAVHPLYVWLRRERVRPRQYLLALAAVAVLIIPAVPHALSVFDRRAILEIVIPVSPSDLFSVLIPSVLVGSIAVGVLIAATRSRVSISAPPTAPASALLSVGLWLLPPAILYAITEAGSTLFEPRYLFFALPGLAIAGGIAMRFLEPDGTRRTAVLAVAIIGLLAFNTRTHSGENWRAAAALERAIAEPNTPVLFRPNFIEGKQVEWLSQPERLEYLLAELSPYPMEGQIVPIPYDLTPRAKAYLERVLDSTLQGIDRFVLVNDRGFFRPWLEGRLAGFETKSFSDGGVVTLVVFEKRPG